MADGWPSSFLVSMRAFYDGDAYPALGLYFRFLDVAVSLFQLCSEIFFYLCAAAD